MSKTVRIRGGCRQKRGAKVTKGGSESTVELAAAQKTVPIEINVSLVMWRLGIRRLHTVQLHLIQGRNKQGQLLAEPVDFPRLPGHHGIEFVTQPFQVSNMGLDPC